MAMSPRQEVAQNLVETCMFGGLDDSYGVNLNKEELNGKSFWSVTFAKAAILDGVIRVYSPNFIQVKWQGKMGKGSEVFRSEHAAKQFLQQTFVQP